MTEFTWNHAYEAQSEEQTKKDKEAFLKYFSKENPFYYRNLEMELELQLKRYLKNQAEKISKIIGYSPSFFGFSLGNSNLEECIKNTTPEQQEKINKIAINIKKYVERIKRELDEIKKEEIVPDFKVKP